MEEIPLLASFHRVAVGKGTEIVGIAIDNAAKVREFAAKYKIPYPVLIAGPEAFELLPRLGNKAGALPFTVGLDGRGVLTYRKLGALRQADLEGALNTLVG